MGVVILLLTLAAISLAFAGSIARRMVHWRAGRLPEPLCARLLEEWLGEIAALTPARKLTFALGVALTRTRTFARADAAGEAHALTEPVASLPQIGLTMPAGLWSRVMATVIDVAVMMLIATPLMPIHTALALSFPFHRLNDLTPILPLGILFNVWFVARFGGSPGKLMMKLRIVAVASTPLGWRHVWRRTSPLALIHIVLVALTTMTFLASGLDAQAYAALSASEQDALAGNPVTGFFGLAALAFILADAFITYHDADHRSLRDRIAGTMVVYAEPRPINSTETLRLRG